MVALGDRQNSCSLLETSFMVLPHVANCPPPRSLTQLFEGICVDHMIIVCLAPQLAPGVLSDVPTIDVLSDPLVERQMYMPSGYKVRKPGNSHL